MRFGLVLPVYNNSSYLSACVESVLKQSKPFNEIIIVDDCSSEPAVQEILRRYEGIPTINCFSHSENRGIVAAQNTALGACTSDYVAFLDCDDKLDECALSVMSSAIAKTGCDYCFSDRIHIDQEGKGISEYEVDQKIRAHRYGLGDLLLDHMVASHLKVIKRDALARAGSFEAGTDGVQDWDIALKVSEFGRLQHVPEKLYFHRLHHTQTSNDDRARVFKLTNEVRRRALRRRGFVVDKEPSRINFPLISKLLSRVKMRLDEIRKSHFGLCEDALAIVFAQGRMSLFAISELPNVVLEPDNAVIFVLCDRNADIGQLRRVTWIARSTVVYLAFNEQYSIAMAQWFNSYFDIMVPLTPEAELGVLGYAWDGLITLPYPADHQTRNAPS